MRYTVRNGRKSPLKSSGRPRALSDAQEDELEAFVRSSLETRKMSYFELSIHFSLWNVGETAIKCSLRRRGYSRCVARQKPPLSNAQKNKRLAWAHSHLNWTLEDWCRVLWSDETYIGDARPTSPHITRKVCLRLLFSRLRLFLRIG